MASEKRPFGEGVRPGDDPPLGGLAPVMQNVNDNWPAIKRVPEFSPEPRGISMLKPVLKLLVAESLSDPNDPKREARLAELKARLDEIKAASEPIPDPEAVAKPSTMYTTFDELKADYDRLKNPE